MSEITLISIIIYLIIGVIAFFAQFVSCACNPKISFGESLLMIFWVGVLWPIVFIGYSISLLVKCIKNKFKF